MILDGGSCIQLRLKSYILRFLKEITNWPLGCSKKYQKVVGRGDVSEQPLIWHCLEKLS